jgi:hypothetical protein
MKIITLIILLLLALPCQAVAQQNAQLYTWIDRPSESVAVRASRLEFSGWAFHCTYGQQPQRLTVYYIEDDGTQVVVPYYYRTGDTQFGALRQHRPDVQRAFASYCPAAGAYIGFSFQLAAAVPHGMRTFMLVWQDRNAMHTDYRTIFITE